MYTAVLIQSYISHIRYIFDIIQSKVTTEYALMYTAAFIQSYISHIHYIFVKK
jgi:hypothetical protein